jgi:hypothetical protein
MLEIGAVWGMDPLAGVFIALPAASLLTDFGVRAHHVFYKHICRDIGALRGFSVALSAWQ